MANAEKLCLVTGATGAVGPGVVQELVSAGYRVRTLSLDEPASQLFPDGVECRQGDVTNPTVVTAAMDGVGAVIHLAARLHEARLDPAMAAEYDHVNVGGTAVVTEAAVGAGVDRIILASTIAIYGPSLGQILNDDTPPAPDTVYGRTKLQAEQIVLAALDGGGRPAGVVLRLAAVYGSRVKGNYHRLVRALERRRFLPIGSGTNRRTLIHERDAAAAMLLALRHPAAVGRVFNVSDGYWHTLAEIIASICQALGRRPPIYRLPVAPIRLAAAAAEVPFRLAGKKPHLGRAMVDKYLEDLAVDCSRIQRELGFQPGIDLAAGWQSTIREMRLNGEL